MKIFQNVSEKTEAENNSRCSHLRVSHTAPSMWVPRSASCPSSVWEWVLRAVQRGTSPSSGSGGEQGGQETPKAACCLQHLPTSLPYGRTSCLSGHTRVPEPHTPSPLLPAHSCSWSCCFLALLGPWAGQRDQHCPTNLAAMAGWCAACAWRADKVLPGGIQALESYCTSLKFIINNVELLIVEL